MIAGDLDLERALRDPAYLRTIMEQAGLSAPRKERPTEAPPAADEAKTGQTPYAR
jgi:hypothetical protein